jgi:hypothetical protein
MLESRHEMWRRRKNLLYHHTIPELYKSVTIRAINEHDLTNLGLSILAQSAKQLRHVRHLQLTAPFQNRLRSRCPYYEGDDQTINRDEDDAITDESDDETGDDLSSNQSSDELGDDLTNETNNETEHNPIEQ